jgi:hypothetical protein
MLFNFYRSVLPYILYRFVLPYILYRFVLPYILYRFVHMRTRIIIKLNFQAVWKVRSSFFWDVTRRKLVVIDRRPDTSVNYYNYMLRNIKEEQRSHLHSGGNLNSPIFWKNKGLSSTKIR